MSVDQQPSPEITPGPPRSGKDVLIDFIKKQFVIKRTKERSAMPAGIDVNKILKMPLDKAVVYLAQDTGVNQDVRKVFEGIIAQQKNPSEQYVKDIFKAIRTLQTIELKDEERDVCGKVVYGMLQDAAEQLHIDESRMQELVQEEMRDTMDEAIHLQKERSVMESTLAELPNFTDLDREAQQVIDGLRAAGVEDSQMEANLVGQYGNVLDQIKNMASKIPTDLRPGTPEFERKARELHETAKKQLEGIARAFGMSRNLEAVTVHQGGWEPVIGGVTIDVSNIPPNLVGNVYNNFTEYIDQVYESPGSLARYLTEQIPNPAFDSRRPTDMTTVPPTNPRYIHNTIYEYLMVPTNHRARDYVFKKILSNVLKRRDSEAERLLDMYERNDLQAFMYFVNEVGKRDGKTGNVLPLDDQTQHRSPGEMGTRPLGSVLVERYVFEQDAIFQSHNADFQAAHPAGDVRNFSQAAALYRNEYGVLAASNPVIIAAMHAYEQSLLLIRDSNGGYIPPSIIGYDPNNETYWWDELAKGMFMKAIEQGAIPSIQIDPLSGLPIVKDGVVQIDTAHPMGINDIDELEVLKIMKLAKGFGIISLRLLEIFGNSRGPGSNHPEWSAGGFHSIPYEGLARFMNANVHMLTKWQNGGEYFHAIFQQIFDPEHKKGTFTSEDVFEIYRAVVDKDDDRLVELIGEEGARLMDEDNLDNMSGAFGIMTKWRIGDAIRGWSDRKRLYLGGGLRLSMAHGWAEGKVEDYLIAHGRTRADINRIRNPSGDLLRHPVQWFQRKQDLESHRGPYQHWFDDGHGAGHGHSVTQKLERAHNAYVWVDMTEWNPLLIARNYVIEKRRIQNTATGEVSDDVFQDTLRHRIIRDILGIDLFNEQFRTFASPTDATKDALQRIAQLEADVAAVREKLLTAGPNGGPRAVQLQDIHAVITTGVTETMTAQEIKDRAATGRPGPAVLLTMEQRRKHVMDYYDKVHQAMTGQAISWGGDETVITGHTHLHTDHIKHELGLEMAAGSDTIDIDWNKIMGHDADHAIDHHDALKYLARKDWRYLVGTDDTNWREIDLPNLGARQWVRRAGDLAAHAEGINKVGEYLFHTLKPDADMDDLIKTLFEARAIFAGDDAGISWKLGYVLGQATGRLFEPRVFGSSKLADTPLGPILGKFGNITMMQKLLGSHGYHSSEPWYANKRREWVDKLLKARIVPGDSMNPFGQRYPFNAHGLTKELHATDWDQVWHLASLGLPTMVAVVLVASILAGIRGEFDEGGGGGGGGAHGHGH